MSDPKNYIGTDNLEAMAAARRYNRFLVSFAERYMSRSSPCLDFGAGIGTFSALVSDEGFDVVALDPDEAHIHAMEAKGLATLSSLADTASGSFGGAFSFNVLEHIEDDQSIIEEVARVLAPGACLVVFVPALPWLWTAMDTKVGHFRRYTKAELRGKMLRGGFIIERLEYADSLGVLATLAYKAIGNRNGDIDPRSVGVYDSLVFPASRTVDRLAKRFVGKNLVVVGRKPGSRRMVPSGVLGPS